MEKLIIDIMEQYGYVGIFLLIMIENLFPPIPSEVILTFGGFMTTTTKLTVVGVILVSTIGSVLGAIILYYLGKIIGVERTEKFIDKWGRTLRLTRKDVDRANDWFSKYGVWTVFFCRFIPLIRSLISIPAGMSHMNFGLFILFTTLGTLIWNSALVYVGLVVGESWEIILDYMSYYSTGIFVVIVIVVAVFLHKYRRRKKG